MLDGEDTFAYTVTGGQRYDGSEQAIPKPEISARTGVSLMASAISLDSTAHYDRSHRSTGAIKDKGLQVRLQKLSDCSI